MTQRKFELVRSDSIMIASHILYRIRRLKTGELGGYVEHERNLSHEGESWLYGNACAFQNSRVEGDAVAVRDAWIYGNAIMTDKSRAYENAHLRDNAVLCCSAVASSFAVVTNKASIDPVIIRLRNIYATITDNHVYVNGTLLTVDELRQLILSPYVEPKNRLGPNEKWSTLQRYGSGLLQIAEVHSMEALYAVNA